MCISLYKLFGIELTLHYFKDNSNENDYVIDPIRLYSIINEKSRSFLLLDARPSSDYKVNVTFCLSSKPKGPRQPWCSRCSRIHRFWWGRLILNLLFWRKAIFVPLIFLQKSLHLWLLEYVKESAPPVLKSQRRPWILKNNAMYLKFSVTYLE